jgi:WD40 repeat protein
VELWDADTGEVLQEWPEDHGTISRLAFAPDGRRLVWGANPILDPTASSRVTVWNLARGDLEAVLTGHTGYLATLDFQADGSRLATGNIHGTLKMWDTKHWQETFSFRPVAESIWAFSPDGFRLATGGTRNDFLTWDLSQH